MGRILDFILGRKEPEEPIDVVAIHESRTAGMCTLAPQVSAWRNWLEGHTEDIEQERDAVVVDIDRLSGTEQGLKELKGATARHIKTVENTRETMRNLLDSLTLEPDPPAEDVIGLHETALTDLQREQQESLTSVLRTLGEEMDSMTDREGDIETELEGVESKLTRLARSKENLDAEEEVTRAFQENIATFMVSKIAPQETREAKEN